jgi:hypothetical protein
LRQHAECRPPQGWAESFVIFSPKVSADVLAAGQSEAIQRVDNRRQVPLRQVQILSGGLQIVMPEQNLDRAQIGSSFQ